MNELTKKRIRDLHLKGYSREELSIMYGRPVAYINKILSSSSNCRNNKNKKPVTTNDTYRVKI
jgi:hypothetical protein